MKKLFILILLAVTTFLDANLFEITDHTHEFLRLHPDKALLPKIIVKKAFNKNPCSEHEGVADLYIFVSSNTFQPIKIAHATYQKYSDRHFLDLLEVEGSYQGRKIGSTLARMALSDSLPNCPDIVTLARPLHRDNSSYQEKELKLQRLIKFYESLGGVLDKRTVTISCAHYVNFNTSKCMV